MTACRWTSSTTPRVLAGRHEPDCRGIVAFRGADDYDECRGCQPCHEPHCAVCRRTHADGTCAECVAATRDDLATIRLMCGALPAEVRHRGINGSAMTLLGPSADPEAWNHTEASVLSGRLPSDWIEAGNGELHPLFVLGTWDMVWRDHLEHEEPAEKVTVQTAGAYLAQQMTYMAGVVDVPFEDFAGDLRKCVDHIRSILHDQNQGDRANVGCFDCGGDLERKLTGAGFEDVWTCRRCRRKYTQTEYNLAIRANLEAATIREAS